MYAYAYILELLNHYIKIINISRDQTFSHELSENSGHEANSQCHEILTPKTYLPTRSNEIKSNVDIYYNSTMASYPTS